MIRKYTYMVLNLEDSLQTMPASVKTLLPRTKPPCDQIVTDHIF